jgi:hypothetical protein
MVEEWLEEHGQLYPVVSEECACLSSPSGKET